MYAAGTLQFPHYYNKQSLFIQTGQVLQGALMQPPICFHAGSLITSLAQPSSETCTHVATMGPHKRAADLREKAN